MQDLFDHDSPLRGAVPRVRAGLSRCRENGCLLHGIPCPQALIAMALFSAALAGCGGGKEPDLVEAGGVVTYSGEPVPDANVVFVPDQGGSPSVGHTDNQGRFTLVTGGREGAAPGSYKLGITAIRHTREVSDEEFDEMSDEERTALVEWLIPQKYAHPGTSGLTASVQTDSSENQYTLELE